MRRPVVLLVEDDDDLRETLVAPLLRAGLQVVGAVDGEDAGRLLLNGLVPDLVLLDMMLPRRHGAQVLELIESSETLAGVPVIVISAAPGWASFGAGEKRAFLQKPFELDALLRQVLKFVVSSG
jgi:DNA-binding response OmpR family regulator